jgi:trk system potassium uptake protein TrkH
VGLSTGVTPRLGDGARLVVTALMFVGRVGPLTLAAIFVGDERPDDLLHPEEQTMVG